MSNKAYSLTSYSWQAGVLSALSVGLQWFEFLI